MNNSAITNKSCPEPGYLDASVVDVLAPNLKWRLSGVTATVVRLVPIQAKEISIAAVGPNLPFTVPQIRIRDLLFMSKEGPLGARVWHARRNNEMIVGLFLKMFLGKNLRLLFTSASQRRHTWISRLLMGQMEAIVSTSKATAAYLKRDSLVVHHGIDLDGFAPLDDCTPLRTKLGLPKTSLLIGCYGRIRFQKGTDVFVDAMLELLPRYPEVTAVVMGRATAAHESFLQDLNNRVRAAGLKERILFLPEVPVEQMADWYRVLDLFVAPQRWEGFGLTPLEAMACGVPVVATRTGAFEELILEAECGFLVQPANSIEIAEGCAELVRSDSLRRSFSQRARWRVEEDFSINSEANALNDIYRKLLGKTRTEDSEPLRQN